MKKSLLYIAAGMLLLTGCNLDINDDPNYPSNDDITANLIFPSVENAVADVVGDQMFNYAGFFAQYFEQKPTANQYNDLAELKLDESSNLFDRCYRLLYAGALEDIEQVKGRVTNTSDLFACAVMRAYCFQLLVDNMDQAPYEEALQGSGNAMPKWDSGQAVYEGVLAELDEAQAALTGEAMSVTDPMLNKDLNQWIGLANALRLRMYLRLIDGNVDAAGYTAKAKALVSADNFFTGNVTWDVYSNAEGQYSPWYGSYFALGTGNHVAAYPIVTYYEYTNDPRIAYAIDKTAHDGVYAGQIPGSKTLLKDWTGIAVNSSDQYVSAIRYTPAINMPIYLYTQAELQFLIAEVQMRFNNNASAAQAAYEAGVRADFSDRGIAGAADFLAAGGSWTAATNKLELIYMQKWVSLFYRDHMEAWTELRRTDVPALSPYTGKQINDDPTVYTAGNMIVPAVNYILAGGLPKRVPYPAIARQLNNNTPETKLLSDRVFWDVK